MRKFNRRSFNKQMGAGFLLSSFLSAFDRKAAHAQAGKKAKRLFLFCSMGTAPSLWSPTNVSGEDNFTFSPAMSPLAAIKGDVVLAEDLASANPGSGHGVPDALTGKGYIGKVISVDQFIGDGLRANGINRPIPVLLLGADARTGGMSMFNRDQNLFTITSPLSAFNTVFGGVTGGTGMPGAMPPDTLLKRRKSILDLLRNEINEINQAIGTQERAKLDLHLESIRNLENRLGQASMNGGPVAACKPPARPTENLSNPIRANLTHIDVLINAFACDITRVGAVQFGSDEAMQVDIPEIGLKGEQHSGMIHSGAPGLAQLQILEKWFAEQFVAVVKKLKSIPEADGSGTLFDNTLLVWCRDMGDAPAHNRRSMKYVVSGGAGGYLKRGPNGRYLKGAGDGAGDLHERLLLNMCEAMGVTNFTGFGDPNLKGAGKTPIPGLRA
ncbi:MAG TPA: DUF1552 domain-containing protein [Polyangia bacterium]